MFDYLQQSSFFKLCLSVFPDFFQAGLFTRICNILHPLFFSRSVHTQESRIFDYEVLLAATNENMVKGSEPPVKKEWMKDETNKSRDRPAKILRRQTPNFHKTIIGEIVNNAMK